MPGKRSSKAQQLKVSSLFNTIAGPVGRMLLFSAGKGWQHGIQKRAGHVALKGRTPAQQCPCNRWKKLDAYWVANAATLKPVWDAAVKAKGITGYQIFMNENMKSCGQTGKLCSFPSPSGGYESDHYIPGGGNVPPAGDWIGKWTPPGEPRYSCVDGECVEHLLGEYASLAACLADCAPPPPRYKCVDGVCVEDVAGEFETLEACQAACAPAPTCCELEFATYGPKGEGMTEEEAIADLAVQMVARDVQFAVPDPPQFAPFCIYKWFGRTWTDDTGRPPPWPRWEAFPIFDFWREVCHMPSACCKHFTFGDGAPTLKESCYYCEPFVDWGCKFRLAFSHVWVEVWGVGGQHIYQLDNEDDCHPDLRAAAALSPAPSPATAPDAPEKKDMSGCLPCKAKRIDMMKERAALARAARAAEKTGGTA